MSSIEDTLAERGARYGDFAKHASIAQQLQTVMREQHGWHNLAMDQRQALTVIADKIARVLNGDPNYRDNWHDIIGYAKLVEDRLAKDEERAALGAGLFDAPRGSVARPERARVGTPYLHPGGTVTTSLSGKTVGIPSDQDYGFGGTEQSV